MALSRYWSAYHNKRTCGGIHQPANMVAAVASRKVAITRIDLTTHLKLRQVIHYRLQWSVIKSEPPAWRRGFFRWFGSERRRDSASAVLTKDCARARIYREGVQGDLRKLAKSWQHFADRSE